MGKKFFLGFPIQFTIVVLTFLVMLLGGKIFLIGSFIFFCLGALFEWIIMSRFYCIRKKRKKLKGFNLKIKKGIFWVHGIVEFIKIEHSTIYDYKTFGYLTGIISYLNMFLYVLISFFLFKYINFYAFAIYLIPIITNLTYFLKNRYGILKSK